MASSPTFDADLFRRELNDLPQFHFIGSALDIRHKDDDFSFRGWLSVIHKDVLVLLRCSSSQSSSSSSSSAAAAAAAAEVLVDVAMSPTSPPNQRRQQLLQKTPNITILKKNVLNIDIVDQDSIPAISDSSSSTAGSKLVAQMFGRKLIVHRALGAIPESTSDSEFLCGCGVHYIEHIGSGDRHVERRRALGGGDDDADDDDDDEYDDVMSLSARELDDLRLELATAVHETAVMEQALGRHGVGIFGIGAAAAAGAGGVPAMNNRLARLFAAIDNADVRNAMREHRGVLRTWGARATGIAALSAAALSVYGGYLFVAATGTQAIVNDHTFVLRVGGCCCGAVALLFAIFLGWERDYISEMRADLLEQYRIARYIMLVVVVAPAFLLFIAATAGLDGWQYDVVRRNSLQEAYNAKLAAEPEQLCTFFRTKFCSGLSLPCVNATLQCPVSPNTCKWVSATTPCDEHLAELLQSFSRPALIMMCVVIVATGATLFVQHRLEVLVREIVALGLLQ